MRNDTGEPPATSSQAPAAAGNISCEATKTPDATSGADPAGKPADTHAEGACQGRGKQFRVSEGFRRRNARREWPPQVWCRT